MRQSIAHPSPVRAEPQPPPPAPCSWRWLEPPLFSPDDNRSSGQLLVNDEPYSVEQLFFEHDNGAGALRYIVVKNRDFAEPYFLDLDPADGSWHCTCASFVYRQEPAGKQCKHLQAVLAAFEAHECGEPPDHREEVPEAPAPTVVVVGRGALSGMSSTGGRP